MNYIAVSRRHSCGTNPIKVHDCASVNEIHSHIINTSAVYSSPYFLHTKDSCKTYIASLLFMQKP